MTLKIIIYHSSLIRSRHFTSHNDLFRTLFGVFHGGAKVTSFLKLNSDVTFNVACELSRPRGETEFSIIAKNRINSVS